MVKKTQWIHSVPAWALGERSRNSKFGGGVVLDGIPLVSDRLCAVMQLSKKLGLTGADALRSSGHSMLEVKTSIGKYQHHNASTAIRYADLKSGIKNGVFPKWVAMTAPQFGFKGAERGGMISKRPADREMAWALHNEAIERSQELEQLGLGAGISIWWPAFTSRIVDDPANPPMNFEEAWAMMLDFWVGMLKITHGIMWLEWKPGDPGIDYLMTVELAIQFCKAVNDALGRMAMFINNEFAHILLSGISVERGVRMTVDAGLFSRFVHANSGQRMPNNIQLMLSEGVPPEQILIGSDWDWAVGVGGVGNWTDQQNAIGVMDVAGQNVIYCEHDVNPAGLNPLKVFALSIINAQKMLAASRAASEESEPAATGTA